MTIGFLEHDYAYQFNNMCVNHLCDIHKRLIVSVSSEAEHPSKITKAIGVNGEGTVILSFYFL